MLMYANDAKKLIRKQNGYVTLISVLLVGAVGLATAVSLLFIGFNNSSTAFTMEQSNQAKALANACAEEALKQISNLISFTGQGNLSLGRGNCIYNVSANGNGKIITSSGTVSNIIRKVKITVDATTPKINVASWQEVADF